MVKYLGLDLGGTNIKVAVIEKKNGSWQVLKKDDHATEADGGPAHVVDRLASLAKENLNELLFSSNKTKKGRVVRKKFFL